MVSAGCITRGHTLEVDVGWGSSKVVSQDYVAELALVDNSRTRRFTKTFPISDSHPFSLSSPLTLFWEYYKLPLMDDVETGAYSLVLSLQDAATGAAAGEPYVLQEIVVQDDVCQFGPIEDATSVNAVFGDRLRLLAYDFEQDDQLNLRLYYQANQRMDRDFKIFVHVFDPTTDVPMAQDDAMPHRNAYPTSYWGLEEVVEDHIRIFLRDVPPGSYGLAVGVYDPDTGERLEVIDGDGKIATDGRLILTELVTVR
jgi:hypothetical protein